MILKMMWLKFLLIWRFFRLVALIDGIDAPENMLRCMSNNFSLEGFWKGWHASFNKWIVKYMYVPMGGANQKLWNGKVKIILCYFYDFMISLVIILVLHITASLDYIFLCCSLA